MSSADTLNFGPQWLRDLSEGSASSSSAGSGQSSQALSKFKLAENRYGREEMLALFIEESEVPDELHRAPSLVSEIVQIPLALRAAAEHSQPQLTSFRSRGVASGSRGRSITNRGRGRGRGSAWADHDDGPHRRPPLRRSESEDWRSDSLRGKGDGAEDIMNGLKEWRVSGHRGGADFWKDAWQDKSEDGGDQRYSRSRSLSLKDHEEGDHLWQDSKMNGIHTKQSDAANVDRKEEQRKVQEGKNLSQEEDVTIAEPASDQYPVDSGGSNKLSTPLEALHEHQEETVTQEGQHSSVLHLSEEKYQLEHHEDPLEDVYKKLSKSDPQERTMNISPNTMSNQFQSLNSDVVDTATSHTSQMSSLPSEPISSNSPMAQLQVLATTWYYKDPQGDIQGPFTSSQMLEWFNAGYFTMGLLVKRACDQEFTPLGELIKRWGQIPFTSSAPKGAFAPAKTIADPISSTSQVQYTKPVQHHMQTPSQAQGLIKRMSSMNDIQSILEKLLENPEFCRLSPQEQQVVVAQYAERLKRRSLLSAVKQIPNLTDPNPLLSNTSQASIFQSEAILRQKMLDEARRKEEEEIRKIQKQQEEQKELLRRQEEEFRKKKELLMLEEQRIKQLHLEAQQKKREIEEDERRKKLQEMQEIERRRREEEERLQQERELQRRLAEQRRLEEEKEELRKREERRQIEEEARKAEEMRRLEIYREEQRMLEEKRRQEQRDREVMEAEIQRREAARLQMEREEEARLALKKQREKQMQAPLPHQSRWGQVHTAPVKNESLSLVEIQKLETEVEKARIEEEARMAKEQRNQTPKLRSGWGANRDISAGLSLVDIQREEAKQMSFSKHTIVNTKPEITKPANFGSSWSKPLKIQPDPPKQNKTQSSFWDQVVEENPSKKPTVAKDKPVEQSQPNDKQKKGPKQKGKGSDEQQVKAIFKQQISKDRFTDWCENYLRKMNVGSIDVPTFVNFLRDVESPHEVQEYVQSYLGESKSARDFTTLFLEERAKLSSPHDSLHALDRQRNAASRDTDGFEVVTSNAKRKKKLRKLQKVDPSILGFSVNAASDRVNMGEIETAHD